MDCAMSVNQPGLLSLNPGISAKSLQPVPLKSSVRPMAKTLPVTDWEEYRVLIVAL